jgi:NADH dehydrogenase
MDTSLPFAGLKVLDTASFIAAPAAAAVLSDFGADVIKVEPPGMGDPQRIIGDLMALDGLPGVAQVAQQSGIHAARTISRHLGGGGERPFHYRNLGTMATIARFRAVAFVGRGRFSGPVAWLMWLAVHLMFLTGFRNRLATLVSWTVAFLGHDRRQRTVTKQQVFARTSAGRPSTGIPPEFEEEGSRWP